MTKKKKTRLAKRGGKTKKKKREGRREEGRAWRARGSKGREERASGLFVLIMQTSDGIGDAKESCPAHLRSPPLLVNYWKIGEKTLRCPPVAVAVALGSHFSVDSGGWIFTTSWFGNLP